jgi:hypothetical protein
MTPKRTDSADLEARLSELGARIELPATPALAARVAAEVRARPRRSRVRVLAPRPLERRAAALALGAIVLLGTIVLIASPAARTAVAGWLGLPGVRIEADGPAPSPGELGTDLHLGKRTTLAAAEAQTPFRILLPRARDLGEPDAVYLAYPPASGRVALVYGARPGIPRTDATGVGLLLMEFEARLDEDLLEKTVFEGGTVEPVTIGSKPGYWIGGGPHAVRLIDPGGGVVEDPLRLAARTLLWQHHGVTLRLEGALSKTEAVRLAATVS